MLALSMKVIEPALRPSSSVQVGVQVNGQSARTAKLSDEELLERVAQIQRDVEMRQLVDVDARVLPPPASPEAAGEAIDVGEGEQYPRPEDLL